MEKKRIILYPLFTVIVLMIVLLPGYSHLQRLREENEQYKKRIELLERHNDELKSELAQMENDPVYLEKKAREKLGIIKKGEVIYTGKD